MATRHKVLPQYEFRCQSCGRTNEAIFYKRHGFEVFKAEPFKFSACGPFVREAISKNGFYQFPFRERCGECGQNSRTIIYQIRPDKVSA